MKSTERVILTKREWFYHFRISIYLLIITVMLACFSITAQTPDELIYIALIFLAVSVFIYWQSWDRLFFQEYKAEITDEQFQRAIEITAKELNWQVAILEGNYAEACRYPEALGIGGEKITVKKTADIVFINSIENPELLRGHSLKRNKENVNSFLINTAHILKGRDVEKIVAEKLIKEEEAFWKESEWTIKIILMRIVGYGSTIIFLLIGMVIIYEDVWKGILPVILSIGICYIYVKYDIQIIREKNRRKKL